MIKLIFGENIKSKTVDAVNAGPRNRKNKKPKT